MLKLVAFSKKRFSDVEAELTNEKNRKKSSNMLYAEAAALGVLNQLKDHPVLKESLLDIIFCTGEGEIGQTFEFYKNLANGERARPLVFQNSLHNSTLGDLSLTIPSISSGMTVSQGDISAEMGIDLAMAATSINPILIICTDAYVDEVLKVRKKAYAQNVDLLSGSCAGLFIPKHSPFFNQFDVPTISDIKIKMDGDHSHMDFQSFYPANGLEEIFEKMQTSKSFITNRPRSYQIHVSLL